MESGKAYLKIDKEWNMDELARLSKLYNQCYSLIYSLSSFEVDSSDQRVIDWFQGAYAKYPWRGGFSTVNFYFSLYSKIPALDRPNIKKIKYESPGFILLEEALVVAGALSGIVIAVCASLEKIHDLYHKIQTGLSERKLTRMKVALTELELESANLEFIRKSKQELTMEMNIPLDMQIELARRCEGNELMELKILMSLYRRVEPLAEMQSEGKLKVENPLERQDGEGEI